MSSKELRLVKPGPPWVGSMTPKQETPGHCAPSKRKTLNWTALAWLNTLLPGHRTGGTRCPRRLAEQGAREGITVAVAR